MIAQTLSARPLCTRSRPQQHVHSAPVARKASRERRGASTHSAAPAKHTFSERPASFVAHAQSTSASRRRGMVCCPWSGPRRPWRVRIMFDSQCAPKQYSLTDAAARRARRPSLHDGPIRRVQQAWLPARAVRGGTVVHTSSALQSSDSLQSAVLRKRRTPVAASALLLSRTSNRCQSASSRQARQRRSHGS